MSPVPGRENRRIRFQLKLRLTSPVPPSSALGRRSGRAARPAHGAECSALRISHCRRIPDTSTHLVNEVGPPAERRPRQPLSPDVDKDGNEATSGDAYMYRVGCGAQGAGRALPHPCPRLTQFPAPRAAAAGARDESPKSPESYLS
ncbi:hypothetical protein EVAR_7452_1 [Eumeta japonica]|uniref:Uncharacterized protein n=1 Tax=Eumeta variegata TaxID=151549 RepID=A0A4C1V6X3_EUMVA|nr:hypothetical protein EVAR_7452_1 [Eumeta japonica]